jgi:glucose/arabinose dehydrogenase/PKD repeat protein
LKSFWPQFLFKPLGFTKSYDYFCRIVMERFGAKSILLMFGFALSAIGLTAQSFPEGFQLETVISDVNYPAGMVHEQGISYIWELNGLVWPVVNGVKAADPLIDLREEVGFWNDHGLLSVALDPDFIENGRIYLLYVVDRYHLYQANSPDYDPEANTYEEATIGRVVRYTVDTDSYTSLTADSRVVLIGQTPEEGIPITTISHGLGTLLFGRDKSLLISVGDGNAPGSDYNGTGALPGFGYDDQALADGILKEGENVGAFRSQYLNSYCGKVLRVNPETGDAYPSNPFFDPERPHESISKVWALGFRNPFRMCLVPGTGSEDPADGNPGSIVIGDVGDWTWEEINIITDPGQNFGWPIFQGPEYYYLFEQKFTPDFESPLDEPCSGLSFYRFQDLIVQPRASHDETWAHPCGGTIPNDVRRFVHERPVVAYANDLIAGSDFAPEDSAVVPGFSADGSSIMIGLTDEDSGVESGSDFTGISSVAGVFYGGSSFPEEYVNRYFQADFSGWFRAFSFDDEYRLKGVENWSESIGNVVHISENPNDGSLYLASLFPGAIKRLTFAGNLAPVIVLTEDTLFGTDPLTVEFDASQTYDPEDDEMVFEWDFDDGSSTATGAVVSHTFTSEGGAPRSFEVELTVTDSVGNSRAKTILVSVNNTPPTAEISGFADDYLYPIDQPSSLELIAQVWDAESAVEELDIRWDVYLHHNTHFHLEQSFFEPVREITIQPLGCGIETFWYRFDLTVSDPFGLTVKKSREIFPNCDGSSFVGEPGIIPNPTPNRFTITYPAAPASGQVILRFYKPDGTLVREDFFIAEEGEASRAFTTSGLTSGVYIIELDGGSWKMTEKLVVISSP